MASHRYTLHIPVEVELPDEPCQSYTARLKPCRNTGRIKIDGHTLCPVHLGLFLSCGSILLTTGHEISDVEHERIRKANRNAE